MYKINVLYNAFVVRWTKPKLNPNKLQKEQVITRYCPQKHAYSTLVQKLADNLVGAARYNSKPTIENKLSKYNANFS